jgi:hypothetical protein
VCAVAVVVASRGFARSISHSVARKERLSQFFLHLLTFHKSMDDISLLKGWPFLLLYAKDLKFTRQFERPRTLSVR